MIEHLNNIISDIDLIKKSSKYNLENIDIKDLEDKMYFELSKEEIIKFLTYVYKK